MNKKYLSPNAGAMFANELRGTLAAYQSELATLPQRLSAAKAQGDAAEIRKIKAREAELHGLLMDAAGEARKRAMAAIADHNAERTVLSNAHRARVEERKAALKTLQDKFLAEQADLTAQLQTAESDARNFELEASHAAGSLEQVADELRATIASSAEFV